MMADDLISRQAAIFAILECCDSDFADEYECGYDDGLRKAVHKLKHLPSAQPTMCKYWDNESGFCALHRPSAQLTPTADVVERKKGKWIKVGHCGMTYKCNRCGNYLDFYGVNAGRGDANFCPNCGAQIDEVTE